MFAAQQDLYLGDLLQQSGCPPYGCDGPPNYFFVDPAYEKHPPALPLVPLDEEIDYTPQQVTVPPNTSELQILVEQLNTEWHKQAALNKLNNCQKCENYNESRKVCEPIPDCLGLGPVLKDPVVLQAPTKEETPITPAVKNNPIDTKTLAIAIGVGFVVWYLLNNKND
jgi:hypothetical protein